MLVGKRNGCATLRSLVKSTLAGSAVEPQSQLIAKAIAPRSSSLRPRVLAPNRFKDFW
jgi:hypothetical protein